jgi:hypothetical protein
VTGAINVLSNKENIDWVALYAGRICLDEVARVRRIVRRDLITLPHYLSDIVKYRRTMDDIACVNGLSRSTEPILSNVSIGNALVKCRVHHNEEALKKLRGSGASFRSSASTEWQNTGRPSEHRRSAYEAKSIIAKIRITDADQWLASRQDRNIRLQ